MDRTGLHAESHGIVANVNMVQSSPLPSLNRLPELLGPRGES